MDTLWSLELKFMSQNCLLTTKPTFRKNNLKQLMMINNKRNLWVSAAQSGSINPETWCRALTLRGVSWMKCWMDSPHSLQVERNSNTSGRAAWRTNKPLRVQDTGPEYPCLLPWALNKDQDQGQSLDPDSQVLTLRLQSPNELAENSNDN